MPNGDIGIGTGGKGPISIGGTGMATGAGSVQGIPTGAEGGGGGTHVVGGAGGQQPVTGQQRMVAGLDAWPEQQQPSHGLPGLHGQAVAGGLGGAETFL